MVDNPELVIDSGAAEESKGQEIKIWHWNVNGIRAVLNSNKFQEFVKKGKKNTLLSDQTYYKF